MHVMGIKATVPRVKSTPVGFGSFIRRHKRASITVAVALSLVGQLMLTGDVDLFALNLVGLGIGGMLLRRFICRRTGWRLKR